VELHIYTQRTMRALAAHVPQPLPGISDTDNFMMNVAKGLRALMIVES